MSPFLIRPNTDYTTFKALLDEHFPDIRQRIRDDSNIRPSVIKNELVNDYARIGSFLTHTNAVMLALQRLEQAISDKLTAKVAAEGRAGGTYTALENTLLRDNTLPSGIFKFPSATNARGESIYFKTHKLLSSTLQDLEDLHNFNGRSVDTFEQTPLMDLYPGAKVASNPGKPVASTSGRGDPVAFLTLPDKAKTAPSDWPGRAKPVGVPAVSGILGQAFNKTLLRHGYHFKDPGAGIAHGEYTHRLQWYAVVVKRPDLGLINSPLDIFRSLGSDWCKHAREGVANDGSNLTGYYMWEALFDCAPAGLQLADWRPHSTTFTCPEAMLTQLTPSVLRTDDTHFLLKALMRARNKKRAGNVSGGDSSFERQDYGLRFTGSSTKTIQTATGFKGAYLFWYLSH